MGHFELYYFHLERLLHLHMKTRVWTTVRFPDGSWSYGGRMNEPDYAHCEKWAIEAESGPAAVKKAQAVRRRERAKANRAVTFGGAL